jgi:hypothetical protein
MRTIVSAALLLTFSLQATTISIVPTDMTIQAGSTTQIDIFINDVTDLYAFGFDLVYNPTFLNALDVNEGGELPSAGATFFAPNTIDNIGGTVSGIGDTISGSGPGVNINGILVSVDVAGIAAGTSDLSMANVILLDSNFKNIAFTEDDSSIQVTQSATVTPEPGTWILTGIALLFLLALIPADRRILRRLIPQA